jgi:alginate O-acetyltransferase complex protein AlgI
MTFVSFEFVVFFPLVLLGLMALPTRSSRQLFLLFASWVFYAAGTPWHLAVLATPAIIDYAVALRIEREPDRRARKSWLILSLVTNLGLLAYFKYADFFVGTVASLVGVESAMLSPGLPIGISFFTFKTLSYTIDVYRGQIPACRSAWRYALFVSFFPELVAGPIVRASIFLPQLERTLEWSWRRLGPGLEMVLLGLTKKLVIANRLAILADPVFLSPATYSSGTMLSALVAYSLEIYCDFSGYSDMAIGVARIIGFDLPENFNMPYAATSIADFWRRWHITLSQWLRDYLYIPLGGNRSGTARTCANLMITMLLGGLWHGASWNFVIWGGLHGLGLVVQRLAVGRLPHFPAPLRPLGKFLGWITTYAFVCFCWIFFRAETLDSALYIIRKIAGLEPGGVSGLFLPLYLIVPVVVAAHLIGMAEEDTAGDHAAAGRVPLPRSAYASAAIVTMWVVGIFLFAPLRTSPFIYFQF